MAKAHPCIRTAALDLLSNAEGLSWREGQFLGGICCADRPATDKQRAWVVKLLAKHNRPHLANDAA